MLYTKEDVMDFIEQEDVKFIRLAFCDVFGTQKNISVMASEIQRAFEDGISFDASAIRGFSHSERSDLFLSPDPSTLVILPWRPSHGRVVRLFCNIQYPDGSQFEADSRYILQKEIKRAKDAGITCNFGAEFEFYLFNTDENGEPTNIPHDRASYMDIAPADKGENIRREICLTLEEMDYRPESSHHEEGPGQHEVDFKYSDALRAADNAAAFKLTVNTIAARNGLYASFAPKPLKGYSGNGMHINMSVKHADGKDCTATFLAGIMKHIRGITAFLNPTENSYERLGELKAPKYVTWSPENRSQLIRIPAAKGDYKRIELRSPDSGANPYLAYALLIEAGLDGIEKGLKPGEPTNMDIYNETPEALSAFEMLPRTLKEARTLAAESEIAKRVLPECVIKSYVSGQ